MIIISAILFSAYFIFNIVSNILGRKHETEEDRKIGTYIKKCKYIVLIAAIPFVFKICNNQAERESRFKQNHENYQRYVSSTDMETYYRIVYNASGHDVSISYKARGSKGTLLTFYIAQGTYDTIAYVSDFNILGPRQESLNFTKNDKISLIFDNNVSVTHKIIHGQKNPVQNNILSISSWIKDTTQGPVAVYTITPEIYEEALTQGAHTLKPVKVSQ